MEVGTREQGKQKGGVKEIVAKLMENVAFNYQSGRKGYPSFPKFPSSLFHSLDYRDLHKWMTGLLKQWESIYKQDKK